MTQERGSRSSRTRDFLVAAVVALPVLALIVSLLVPWLVSNVLGGAGQLDAKLRQENAYMQAICGSMAIDRDEALCACVLATEVPSLDCSIPFMTWTLARQHERCGDDATRTRSVSFCVCVDTLWQQLMRARAANDERASRLAAIGYERCAELQDKLSLPTIESLSVP